MATVNNDPGLTDVLAMGKRVASYRKFAGIQTARELAERIENPKITTTVIQNIESGRKLEPSVSQLLDIAKGIGISPVYLLAPVGKPFDKVDIPGVGPEVASMSVNEFVSWLTLQEVEGETEAAQSLREIVHSLQQLLRDVEAEKKAAIDPDLEAEDIEYETEDGDGNAYTAIHSPSEGVQMVLGHLRSSIDLNYNRLKKTSVDVSWVKRPWAEKSE